MNFEPTLIKTAIDDHDSVWEAWRKCNANFSGLADELTVAWSTLYTVIDGGDIEEE